MTRRRRALLLFTFAAVAGLMAMVMVAGYGSSVDRSYGDLQPVVVLSRDLRGGKLFSPEAMASLEVRRVPSRFVPAGAVTRPEEALGFELAVASPAGSYLTAPILRPPSTAKKPRGLGGGRSAVELAVSGAGALDGGQRKVDVLVTSEPKQGGAGSTRLAARGVPLIAVGEPGVSDAGPGLTQVTLGLTRRQAMALVQAESFARRITVLPRGGDG